MKFITDNILLFAMALLSGGMLLWPVLQRRGDKVSILQATQLFNQGKALFIDVREEDEFAKGHVREARNIPLAKLAERIGELSKFKSKQVVVMCATGVRSAKAAAQLKAAGFESVHSMEGGVAAWQGQGLPIIK